jgi:hypothetical protein
MSCLGTKANEYKQKMPLLTETLTLWTIGFRWAGLDPDKLWLRIPLPAKDNFSLLMNAILRGEILCETLTLAKRPSDSKADPKYYIRTYMDEVYACIYGQSYDRNLLRWAQIDRHEFKIWCEAMSIPLPEFWFPPGWKLKFDTPEGGTMALWAEHVEPEEEGDVEISYESYPGQINTKPPPLPQSDKLSLRENQVARLCCQRIASQLWKDDKTRTIASVVQDKLIQKYGGGAHYENDTVRKWIREVAPPEVKNHRGRPKKQASSTENNPDN